MKNRKTQLATAIQIATNAHAGQFDMQGEPYILHALEVLRNSKKYTNDQDIHCAAVLHDVLEDTSTTADDMTKAGISARTIEIIKLLDNRNKDYETEYVNSVLTDIGAVIVKMSDLEHNMDPNRIKDSSEKTINRMAKYTRTMVKMKAAAASHISN